MIAALRLELAEKQKANELLMRENNSLGKDAFRLSLMIQRMMDEAIPDEALDLAARNKALTMCMGNAIQYLVGLNQLIEELPMECFISLQRIMQEKNFKLPSDIDGLVECLLRVEGVRMVYIQGCSFPIIMTTDEADVFDALVAKLRRDIGDSVTEGFGLFAVLHALRFSLIGSHSKVLTAAGDEEGRSDDGETRSVQCVLAMAKQMGMKIGDQRRSNGGSAKARR